MNNKQLVLSEEGYKKLVDELEERKSVIRKKVADDIDLASQQGDLSENAAYKAAMEAKEFNENRITQLDEMVINAVVQKKVTGSIIGLGSTVEIEIEGSKRKMTITLVGQNEADPSGGKISVESPIGYALLKHKKGDKVEVKTPAGVVGYQILNVS